ncbi:hypothetical protein D3850_05685 [Streptococcus mutans]|nr:hypothetical protein [Streptococcus mutans]
MERTFFYVNDRRIIYLNAMVRLMIYFHWNKFSKFDKIKQNQQELEPVGFLYVSLLRCKANA